MNSYFILIYVDSIFAKLKIFVLCSVCEYFRFIFLPNRDYCSYRQFAKFSFVRSDSIRIFKCTYSWSVECYFKYGSYSLLFGYSSNGYIIVIWIFAMWCVYVDLRAINLISFSQLVLNDGLSCLFVFIQSITEINLFII